MKRSGKVGEHGLQLDVLIVVLITMVSHRKSFVGLHDKIEHMTGANWLSDFLSFEEKPSCTEDVKCK